MVEPAGSSKAGQASPQEKRRLPSQQPAATHVQALRCTLSVGANRGVEVPTETAPTKIVGRKICLLCPTFRLQMTLSAMHISNVCKIYTYCG